MHRLIRPIILLVAALAALVAGEVSAQSWSRGPPFPYVHPETKYEFPLDLGRLKLQRTVSFTGYVVDLGVQVPYLRFDPWIKVEIYLYTRNVKNIPDGNDNAAVRTEMSQAIEDIRTFDRRRIYQNLELGDRVHICPVGSVDFLCITANYRGSLHDLNDRLIYPGPHDVPTVSQLFMRGARGHFMKIRGKWHLQDDAAARPIVAQFINELGALLQRQQADKP